MINANIQKTTLSTYPSDFLFLVVFFYFIFRVIIRKLFCMSALITMEFKSKYYIKSIT